jgi:hypothetical protein
VELGNGRNVPKKENTKKQRVELGNERSAQPDEFHFTHFTFRLKRNNGKTTYLPALGNLYAGKKRGKEIDLKKS